MPTTGAAHLGRATHEGTRVYDQHTIDNEPITPDDAEGAFVDFLQHPDEPVEHTSNDLPRKDAERIGRTLVNKYCRLVAPRYTYRAVEIRPEPLDIEVGDVTIRLTGQLDRTRVQGVKGGIGISDLKTGKRAVDTKLNATIKGHGMQLGVYELLAEHCLGDPVVLPATIIGMQTTGPARIGIGTFNNPRAGLIGTEENPGLIQMAAQMLKTGMFPPNPRSMLCHPRYCPRWKECPYHG